MGLFKKEEKNIDTRQWYKKVLENNFKDNIKKYFYFGKDVFKGNEQMIILTNDDKIAIAYKDCFKSLDEKVTMDIIDIHDIMKVDFIINMKTKTKHNWLNIFVLSFEEIQNIESVEIKIITFDKIFRCKLTNISNQENIDMIEIMSIYLNKKIEKNEF